MTGEPELQFLPRPHQIAYDPGAFTLSAETPILIAAGSNPATLRTAQLLQDVIAQVTGLRLTITPATVPSRKGAVSLLDADQLDPTDSQNPRAPPGRPGLRAAHRPWFRYPGRR